MLIFYRFDVSNLQVRQPAFSFDDVEFLWNPSNPAFSVFANSVSFWVIGLERYLVRIVKDADPLITNLEVRDEARLFVQQEAVHSKMHRRHVKALIARYPDLQEAMDSVVALYDDLYDGHDLRYHLAYAAALEGTFTPIFGMIMEHREALFADGDARVASLCLWHFCEEIEHRSSAVMVYDHVIGDHRYKTRVFPSVVLHAARGFTMLADQFQLHVPGEAGADHYGSWATRLLSHRANPFAAVPVAGRLAALRRAMSSIRRDYDHEHQPVPAWVDTWFGDYAAGRDMTTFWGRAAGPGTWATGASR